MISGSGFGEVIGGSDKYYDSEIPGRCKCRCHVELHLRSCVDCAGDHTSCTYCWNHIQDSFFQAHHERCKEMRQIIADFGHIVGV